MRGAPRPDGQSSRVELVLDAAAVIAAGVELHREVTTGSFGMLPVVLLAAAAVAARRRLPQVAAATALVVSGLALLEPDAAVPVWVMAEVVLFSLPLRRERTATFAFGAAHAALLYLGALLVFDAGPLDPVAILLPVWTFAVVAAGLAMRANQDYVRTLRIQARQAAAVRESEVRQRVGAERLRIARDLHDSVAHTVAVVSVHAGAAEKALDSAPDSARESLRQVRASARSILDELQDILSVLRADGDPEAPRALPGVAALGALLEAVRGTGATVDSSLAPLDDVDAAVGVALYRIVQESLTNAQRHGRGTTHVEIRATEQRIELTVTNGLTPGPPAPEGSGAAGFGLVGMRERAASVRGKLTAGPVGDAFVVRASLPVTLHPTTSHPREHT